MTTSEPAKTAINGLPMWEAMTVDEYAEFEKVNGSYVVKMDGVWWRKVRPLFYRQLFPFTVYTHCSPKRPWPSWFGGAQHIVPSYEDANSYLHLRVFENVQNYSIMSLDKNRRRQVKKGSAKILINPVRDIREFQEEGYRVYISFFKRTRYSFRSERTKQSNFVKWAEAVYNYPKIMILGGYENERLCAVSLSYLVENVIFYATFFSLTEHQNSHVSDLMLHSVREIAASYPDVKYIYAGMYKGEKGIDDFYFLRGCKLVRQPAFYRMNPAALSFIKIFMKRDYEKLIGSIRNERALSYVDER